MQTVVELSHPLNEDDHWQYIGDASMLVLHNRYDRDQYWLPGMPPLFFRYEEPVAPYKERKAKAIAAKRLTGLISGDMTCEANFPRRDEHQYVLPLSQLQVPSKTTAGKIRAMDFPAFDRDEKGNVYQLRWTGVVSNKNHPLRQWIFDHCVGRVLIGQLVVFEKEQDAILAMISDVFSKS